jgi:hypothetical protein
MGHGRRPRKIDGRSVLAARGAKTADKISPLIISLAERDGVSLGRLIIQPHTDSAIDVVVAAVVIFCVAKQPSRLLAWFCSHEHDEA